MSSSRPRQAKARKWWRAHFYDHPGHSLKPPTPESEVSGKVKSFCMHCLHALVRNENERDLALIKSGVLTEARADSVIISGLWAIEQKDPRRRWVVSRSETMLNHLKVCSLQPAAVRERATYQLKPPDPVDDHLNSAAHPGTHDAAGPPTMMPLMPLPSPAVTFAHSSTAPSGSLISPIFSPSSSTFAIPTSLHQSMYRGTLSEHIPPFPGYASRPESPASSVGGLSRSVSRARSAAPVISRQPSSSVSEGPFVSNMDPIFWTDYRQRRFETRIARITASAGLPLGWIENPEVVTFMSEFVNPAAVIPTRSTLTRRILPFALREAQEQTHQLITNLPLRFGTVQFDGWTGINSHHYDAFMLALCRSVYSVKVFDATSSRKSGENLHRRLEEVIRILKIDWKVDVIAVCSDAGPDASKARRLLLSAHPSIVSLDCYSHQVGRLMKHIITD